MNKLFAVIVGLLLLVLLLLFSTTYTVPFYEVAIKTKLGKTGAGDEAVVREPGLKFKLPQPLEDVTTLDTRLQLVETPQVEVQIADQQQVVIKAFLMWQVDTGADGPVQFLASFPSVESADEPLRNQLRTAAESALSAYRFNDLIGQESRLNTAEAAILATLKSTCPKGVLPVTVGISQIVLPSKTTTFVLQRMQAERAVLASSERQQGQALATSIRNQANNKADAIVKFAERRAEEIRAEADTQMGQIMERMAKDEGLAIFLAWKDALEKILNENATIFLDRDFAPTHLMNLQGQVADDGIPRPKSMFATPSVAAEPPMAKDGSPAEAAPAASPQE
jgi:membrane protease subunit HflC